MATRAEHAAERLLASRSTPGNAPENLLRELVRHIQNGQSTPAVTLAGTPACQTEEILFDAELDGARYLVVRLLQAERVKMDLSPREHEIARMIARGQHNKAIAGVLNISSWTVATHLRRIFSKLGVNSRAAMVARLAEIDGLHESDARVRARRSVE